MITDKSSTYYKERFYNEYWKIHHTTNTCMLTVLILMSNYDKEAEEKCYGFRRKTVRIFSRDFNERKKGS